MLKNLDYSKVDMSKLKTSEGVLGVVKGEGQLQVIYGPGKVEKITGEVNKIVGKKVSALVVKSSITA